MALPKKSDIKTVFNASTPVPAIAKGIVTIQDFPDIRYEDIIQTTKEAAAAAVAQVDEGTTASSPTAGDVYRITIQQNSLDNIKYKKTYSYTVATGDTQNNVRDKMISTINADTGAIVVADDNGAGVVRLTAKTAGEEFESTYSSQFGSVSTTTANVRSKGKKADLQADGVADADILGTDNYTTYTIEAFLPISGNESSQDTRIIHKERILARVYVNEDTGTILNDIAVVGLDEIFEGPDDDTSATTLKNDIVKYLAKN